jgi:hypothetical protein
MEFSFSLSSIPRVPQDSVILISFILSLHYFLWWRTNSKTVNFAVCQSLFITFSSLRKDIPLYTNSGTPSLPSVTMVIRVCTVHFKVDFPIYRTERQCTPNESEYYLILILS